MASEHDTPISSSVRARLGARAQSALGRARERVRDQARGAVVRAGGEPALQMLRAGREIVRGFDVERLAEGASLVADRIAAIDPAAQELARWAEELVAAHGRERVLRVVLLRNMLIDGSFLEIFEGVLSNDDPLRTPSTEALARARASVARLVDSLAELDGTNRTDLVERGTLALSAPHWEGTSDDASFHRFCLWSYTLFLQSFLLRSVVETTGDLLAGLLPGGASSSTRTIDVDAIASTSPRTESE